VVVDTAARIFGVQLVVAAPSISREQTNSVRNDFAHKAGSGFRSDAFENACDNVALALHRTDDGRLAGSRAATAAALFIPVAIVVLPADVGFVNLDNATEFLLRLDHCRTDFVAHAMRGFVGPEAKLPLNLERANSLFAGRHQMHDLEPIAERLVCVLEDRARDNAEAITHVAARSALRALPVPLAGMQVIDGGVAAARADNALRPAAGFQISRARILVTDWETGLKFPLRHLVNGLRTFCHGGYPSTSTVGEYCHG
jgi:hypothetical protein